MAIADAAPPVDAFDLTATHAIVRARQAQSSPKMKLTAAEAAAAEGYLRVHLDRSRSLRALQELMPHSTVELTRAIEERGVPAAEADRIADYLVGLCQTLDFANLERFDINHSHVTGRQWHEIDYRGENMTWQGQKAYWSKKGVPDFTRAEHVHAYMTHAYRLPHFARVYAPRGDIAGVAAP